MFLELEKTDIGYQTPLIKNINTSLKLGEVCLLIGNNGVGKTTLIKSILNQINILKGNIFLNHKNIQKLSAKEIASEIAVVFSKSNIPQNYTVTDLIALGKYIQYPFYFELSNDDKNEIQHIIDELNLASYQNLQLTKLSDGNLQKAFIGRALAQNSPFIILDEPTTHLDEENKIMILKTLRNIAKNQNKLILFSSHDWRLAKEFSDKIWYIKNEYLYTGLTEDILNQHQYLTNPHLFNFNDDFVPPKIFAPSLERELLYSVLQKNFNANMTNVTFSHQNGNWEIEIQEKKLIAKDFSEIICLVQKYF